MEILTFRIAYSVIAIALAHLYSIDKKKNIHFQFRFVNVKFRYDFNGYDL